jgi:hypothetical protein
MLSPEKNKLLERLLFEQGATLKSVAFWESQPEGMTISDAQSGVYDFREKHLETLRRDLMSIEAAIRALESPNA